MIENSFLISEQGKTVGCSDYWLTRPPDERVEAVELLREQYYSMLGFTEPPSMEKIFVMKKVK